MAEVVVCMNKKKGKGMKRIRKEAKEKWEEGRKEGKGKRKKEKDKRKCK